MSIIVPCNIAGATYFSPQHRAIAGKHTSTEVTPADDIAERGPNRFVIVGMHDSDNISRNAFDNNAMDPISTADIRGVEVDNSGIKIDDRE